MARTAKITRNTKETKIALSLNLDGEGKAKISTGIGFFDHMLNLFTAHSLIDLMLDVHGDLEVDGHHTVEDVGIALGTAFKEALGDKKGIHRYGHFLLPMDETLAQTALDFSGRPYLVYHVPFPVPTTGNFDFDLINEFWQGFVNSSSCNLHVNILQGGNGHHIAEAVFKSVARSIRMAVEMDPRQKGIPSTKGVL
ncbi:MAG: imidazoleglycerol-phosphate dehydratase HisB [Planctomycetia bacterium]|nr:imidazoleglycerol-phosphate dehydratase HisB [Planctomycetia bacterium]